MDIIWVVLMCLAIGATGAVAGVGVAWLITWVRRQVDACRLRRIARIEAELDRVQAQVRATTLQLAVELAAAKQDASRRLSEAAFFAVTEDQRRDRGTDHV